MAQYNKYDSFDFERFEPKTISTSSAAPQIAPKAQEKPKLELVKKQKPSVSEEKQEALVAARKTRQIFVIAVVLFAFFAGLIYSRIQLDEINREISAIDAKMKIAQSDKIKLDNQLNSTISIDKVEDYATNTLGMVKVQEHQVVYIDLSSSDTVVMADGQQVNDDVINETEN
jgi:cell division protein FtsL